jgi:hypothetical protein
MNDMVHGPAVDALHDGSVRLGLSNDQNPPQNVAGLGVAAWMARTCHVGELLTDGEFSLESWRRTCDSCVRAGLPWFEAERVSESVAGSGERQLA